MYNEIIGIQFIDYVSKKTNQRVQGRKVFYTYEDRNVSGKACDNVFLSDRNYADFNLVVGQEIRFFYNKYRQVDFIETK